MKQKLKTLFQRDFIRNVILLATGTAGAQIITVLAAPFITRIYGPEAYGILGTFTAMTNIIIPVAALTYPIAIVLPKKEEEAIGLVQLSLLVTVGVATASLSILLIFNKQIVNIFNLNEISNYIYLIPILMIFAVIMQTTQQCLISTNKLSINAKTVFYQSVIINCSKIWLGYLYPIAIVLVLLTTLSNAVRAILMILFSRLPKINFRNGNIFKLARKHYDFPIYRAPEELLSGISHSIPVLMLTVFFGPASAGFYSIGRSVLSMPSQFIGVAIGDVFYPKAAEMYNKKKSITELIFKTTVVLAGIGIIPFGSVVLFGPQLFSFVFGEAWYTAGSYARWIALWAFT